MLVSASEAYATQQRLAAAAVLMARNAQSSGVLAVARVVAGFQLVAAQQAAAAVPLMLQEQGIQADAAGTVAAASLAGVASNGLPLQTLFDAVKVQYAFERLVATQVQDASRAAGSVAMTARPAVTGYVRMLTPPSCDRCVVLAGRFYRWNAGFQRHPQCDCRHIPTTENVSGDLTTDASAYFDSLSREAQDKAFTQAGAQAIRDGADIGRVVNARRGMSVAQVFGRKAFVTKSGATHAPGGLRLMPETIYQIAQDRADAIRLLKLHGFLL